MLYFKLAIKKLYNSILPYLYPITTIKNVCVAMAGMAQ